MNSPSTTATQSRQALETALDMLGTMIRHITVAQLAPRLLAASERVRMSTAERPASRAR